MNRVAKNFTVFIVLLCALGGLICQHGCSAKSDAKSMNDGAGKAGLGSESLDRQFFEIAYHHVKPFVEITNPEHFSIQYQGDFAVVTFHLPECGPNVLCMRPDYIASITIDRHTKKVVRTFVGS